MITKKTLTGLFALSLILSVMTSNILAQPRHGMKQPPGIEQAPFWNTLTEAQQTEMQTLVETMKNDGADRKTIRDAVHAKLEEWGISFEKGPGPKGRAHMMNLLSADQQQEIQALVQSMRDAGDSREAIHEAVKAKLESWGITPPEGKGHGPHGLFNCLDETQQAAIHALVGSMRESGSSREDIHQAVQDQLTAWGVDCEGSGPKNNPARGNKTNSQRTNRSSNHPNPFNPTTTISYDLENAANGSVSIYNAQGQLIRSMETGVQEAGSREIRWDGTSNNGTSVPSGIYLYHIQAGNESFTGRMMLMK